MESLKNLLLQHAQTRFSRRAFLGTSLLAGLLSACGRGGTPSAGDPEALAERLAGDNIYTRLLGVQPHLPAHDHVTAMGGSRMPPEVLRAMEEANDYFVDMNELTIAAGKRLAEVVHAEAGLVTSGSFGSMVLGAAACLTGLDEEKMKALPHPTWLKRECLMQKAHTFFYDRAYSSAGMDLVVVETREAFANAVNDNTAMIAVLASVEHSMKDDPTVMMPEEFVDIGRKTGVPVLIDAASELPPTENLTRYTEMGADLVVISGGKGIRGPQSTGILAGRADLIEAARLQASPNAHIGRAMKVGKEEIIGFIVALNRYEKLNHDAVHEEWMNKARYIADQLKDVPGLTATVGESDKGVPRVALDWDETALSMTAKDMRDKLMTGRPRVGIFGIEGGNKVVTRCMNDGEEVLVSRRIKQFFMEQTGRNA